jgi:hypothetical protein
MCNYEIPQNMNENGPVVAEIIKDIFVICESEIEITVISRYGFIGSLLTVTICCQKVLYLKVHKFCFSYNLCPNN